MEILSLYVSVFVSRRGEHRLRRFHTILEHRSSDFPVQPQRRYQATNHTRPPRTRAAELNYKAVVYDSNRCAKGVELHRFPQQSFRRTSILQTNLAWTIRRKGTASRWHMLCLSVSVSVSLVLEPDATNRPSRPAGLGPAGEGFRTIYRVQCIPHLRLFSDP